MTKSKELQSLINDLHAFRISSPTTFYHPPILDDAAQVIESLLKELEEERYRHDRLQDWTVARDEARERMEKKIHALTVERNTLEKRVEYVQKERLALYRRLMEVESKLWELEEKDNAEL